MAGVEEGVERCVLGRVMSLSDMVLGFFEDGEGSPEGYLDGDGDAGEGSGDDEGGESPEERRAFWESQHQLLQVALSRNGSLESRIRRDTEAALRQLRSETGACSCSRKAVRECRECLLRGVSERLRSAGYNSAICKSKWRSTGDIPKDHRTRSTAVCSRSRVLGGAHLHRRGGREQREEGPRAGGGGALLPGRVRGGAGEPGLQRPGAPPAGGVRGKAREAARRGQGRLRRREEVHEGQQDAHAAVAQEQVHAGQVALPLRAGAAAAGPRRLPGRPAQAAGVHAHLRPARQLPGPAPHRRGSRVMRARKTPPCAVLDYSV